MGERRLLKFIAMLVICFSLCGCVTQSRDFAVDIGNEYEITEGNTVSVISAQIADGCINVVLQINLIDMKMADFASICVKKAEVGAQEIECNVEKSRDLNEAEVFEIPYQGEITLMFEGNSILATDDLTRYLLELELHFVNGYAKTYKFVLL